MLCAASSAALQRAPSAADWGPDQTKSQQHNNTTHDRDRDSDSDSDSYSDSDSDSDNDHDGENKYRIKCNNNSNNNNNNNNKIIIIIKYWLRPQLKRWLHKWSDSRLMKGAGGSNN